MALFYSPIMGQEDYNSFKDIIGRDLPPTFDEWVDRRCKSDLQLVRVIGIEVNAEAFFRIHSPARG